MWDIWRWWGRGARNPTQEQARFNWAWVWMEEGASMALVEGESQSLLIQVFPFVSSNSLLSALPMVTFRPPDLLLVLFSGAVPIMSDQFSVVGGGMPAARGRVPGDQRPLTGRVCSGWVKGWGPVWHPARAHDLVRALHICWPTSTQEVQAGAHCSSLVPISPRDWSCSLGPNSLRAWGGAWEQGGPPLPIPQPQGAVYPLRWHPYMSTWGTPTRSIIAGLRGSLRDPCPSMPPSALMCAVPIWPWSCHVPSALLPSLLLMPSNGMASGHIALGFQIQLKECYTNM